MSLDEDWMQENNQRVVKMFILALGFGFVPAMAGLVAVFNFSSDIAIAVSIGMAILVQLWAYRKRSLFGRSLRRLVFTSVLIIAGITLYITLGVWPAILSLATAIIWYSQYQMWRNKKHDPWNDINLDNLPQPKVPVKIARKVEQKDEILAVERQAWIALILKPPNRDDISALGWTSLGIICTGLILVTILGLPPNPIIVGGIIVLIVWVIVWWIMIYLTTYIVCGEDWIRFFEITPWGKEIPQLYFKNILAREIDPPFWGRIFGYTPIKLNTAASDESNETVNRELRFVKYPSSTWYLLRR